jgi:hypothetical protein
MPCEQPAAPPALTTAVHPRCRCEAVVRPNVVPHPNANNNRLRRLSSSFQAGRSIAGVLSDAWVSRDAWCPGCVLSCSITRQASTSHKLLQQHSTVYVHRYRAHHIDGKWRVCPASLVSLVSKALNKTKPVISRCAHTHRRSTSVMRAWGCLMLIIPTVGAWCALPGFPPRVTGAHGFKCVTGAHEVEFISSSPTVLIEGCTMLTGPNTAPPPTPNTHTPQGAEGPHQATHSAMICPPPPKTAQPAVLA